MKRAAAAFLAFALLALGQAGAQTSLSVAYGKTIVVTTPGATAAYSVNPSVVEAGLSGGVVQIRGTGGGETTVVVVTATGETTYEVTCMAPQLAVALSAQGGGPGGPGQSAGMYVGGYNSGAGELTNAFEFSDQQGQLQRRLLFEAASYVTPGSGRGVGFPLASYQVSAPGHSVTYLDEMVDNSPLTFEDALIRGIHLTTGPWSFHAGESSIAGFGQYFVLTNPQWTAGVTRGFTLSPSSSVAANLYDIVDTPGAPANAPGGTIGSLLYTYNPQPHFTAQAEVGLSRSVGFDASALYDDPQTHFDATLVDKPAGFATLATDAQQGLFGTLDYSHTIDAALSTDVNAAQTDYDLPGFRENSQTAQGTLNYRVNKRLFVSGGAVYSDYDSLTPTAFNVRTLAFPTTVTYALGNVTLGVQDQPTSNVAGTFANGWGANAAVNAGSLQFSGFFNHNVDIPTVASIFSSIPGLQAALQQAGINVSNPAQLASLLNNAALLSSLGFSGLQLDVSPAQNIFGGNLQWSGPGRREMVYVNYVDMDSQLTQGALKFSLATLGVDRRISYANDIAATVSWLSTNSSTSAYVPSMASTPTFGSHSGQFVYGVTVTHRFATAPSMLFPTRRAPIEGYVFEDNDANGAYTRGDAGMPGVTVTLDGDRTATTDASGHYVFGAVPYGDHEVAAQLGTTKPYYFTTQSPATVKAGERADFGVSFVSGKVFGYVTNDAGEGLANVTVEIAGTKKTTTTGQDGRFTFDGVAQGKYVVTADASTVPAGYDLTTLAPSNVSVDAGVPWPVTVTVHALRSISGTVTAYDPEKGALLPAQYVEVSIPKLGLVSTTDEKGAYAFRDLPAGTYVVQVDGGTTAERHSITMPPDPTAMSEVDFRVTVAQATQRLREHQHHRAGGGRAGRSGGS